jgi:hypothetical protein
LVRILFGEKFSSIRKNVSQNRRVMTTKMSFSGYTKKHSHKKASK